MFYLFALTLRKAPPPSLTFASLLHGVYLFPLCAERSFFFVPTPRLSGLGYANTAECPAWPSARSKCHVWRSCACCASVAALLSRNARARSVCLRLVREDGSAIAFLALPFFSPCYVLLSTNATLLQSHAFLLSMPLHSLPCWTAWCRTSLH